MKTVAKPSKNLNLSETVSSLNSWKSKYNVNKSLYYSTGKKLTGSKKHNKSQAFNLPASSTFYGSFNFNLEQNDYREKLKYLL